MVKWLILVSFCLMSCGYNTQYIIMPMQNCNVCVRADNFEFSDNENCSKEQWEEARKLKKCFTDRRKIWRDIYER